MEALDRTLFSIVAVVFGLAVIIWLFRGLTGSVNLVTMLGASLTIAVIGSLGFIVNQQFSSTALDIAYVPDPTSTPTPTPTPEPVTISGTLSATEDDGRTNGGSMDTANVQCCYQSAPRESYFRFTLSAGIPDGASITAASIDVHKPDPLAEASPELVLSKVRGHDVQSPGLPTSATDFEALPRTDAGVDWDDFSGAAGVTLTSPDISTVIQELADSYDYSAGGQIQILWDDDGTGGTFYSFFDDFSDGNPSTMTITYQE